MLQAYQNCLPLRKYWIMWPSEQTVDNVVIQLLKSLLHSTQTFPIEKLVIVISDGFSATSCLCLSECLMKSVSALQKQNFTHF